MHCVWRRSIVIECEFAGFALNAHFELHSCGQAFRQFETENILSTATTQVG